MANSPTAAIGISDPSEIRRRCDRWVLVVVVLGSLLRLGVLARPAIDGTDINRFEAEARSMLKGRGYALEEPDARKYLGIPHRILVVEHPPGYAVFVALHYALWEDHRFLLLTNWLLSVASIYLLYRAVRPFHCRAALVAAALLAFNPWLIRWTSYLMSEMLGVFLACLLMCQISRVQRQVAGAWGAFSVGLLGVALLLTVPATVFLDAFVILAAAWHFRRRVGPLVALAAGCLLLMVPWQIHCIFATGRVQPTVLKPLDVSQNFTEWVNTWMDDIDQIHVYWNVDFFDQLPDRLFASQQERATLKQAAVDRRKFGGNYPEAERAFGEAARRREAELSPWQHRVVLPLWRSVTMWTHFQQLLWREGWQDRAVRILFLLVNWIYLAVFVVLCAIGLRSRQPLAWAIVAGVLLFTIYNGTIGGMEYRRNYPFYPALLFLFSYWPAGCCGARGGVESERPAA